MPKTNKSESYSRSNILVAIAVSIITISIIGLLSPKKNIAQNKYELNTTDITRSLDFTSASGSGENFDVLSASVSSTPTPTPTPQSVFRHSKWQFSFEIPENSIVAETDPNAPFFVSNSSGGAIVELPETLQVEIAVVQLYGLNIFQYYHNRLATIFDDKIVGFQEATISGQLKKYEIFLENLTNRQKKTLMFLPFRGNQIFEIEAVYLKPNHKKEEEIVKTLISSLKPY